MAQLAQHRHGDLIFLSPLNNGRMKAIDRLEPHRREVGERIRDLRLKKKLTQPQLADLAGIAQPSLSVLEAGKTVEVTARTLFGICRALETTPEYLWIGMADATEAELVAVYRTLDEAGKMAVLQSARTVAAAKGSRDDAILAESNLATGARRQPQGARKHR